MPARFLRARRRRERMTGHKEDWPCEPVGKESGCIHTLILQTLHNALLRDDRLQNCLHYAATGGFFNEFPERFKTPEALALEDARGWTPVDYHNARRGQER